MSRDRYEERDIEFAARLGPQLVKQAIRASLIRGLVEPITNSDDSYARMEGKGIDVDGEIRIHVVRGRRKRPVVGIKDNAEGMDEEVMEEAIGKYGEDMSGLSSGMNVRGVFGRGLKDAILAVGEGDIYSIVGDRLYECHLREPWRFKLDPSKDVTDKERKELQITESGTLVYIIVKKEKVTVPRFDNIKFSLEKSVLLRDIMRNPDRTVILEERDSRGSVKALKTLTYRDPIGETVLDKKSLDIRGFSGITFDIEVKRADDPLTQEGYNREGGLLIKSGRAIHEATLLKYDNNEYAAYLYGEVRCDHLNDLIGKDEPVISDKRDGLNWDYEFCAALGKEIENLLKPIVDEERRRIEKKEKAFGSAETKTRVRKALNELNKIAELELESAGEEGTTGEGETRVPPVPENGFEFIPDYYQVESGKKQTLSLKALSPSILPDGETVEFRSDNPDVIVLESKPLVVEAIRGVDGIVTLNGRIEGKRVGAEGTITAAANGLTAKAVVRVVSIVDKGTPKKRAERGKRGIFSDIVHSSSQDPRKRVRYNEGRIVISTRSPSVSKYFMGGKGIDDPEFKVLESELVTEAVCRTIANLKDHKGEVPYLTESGRIVAIQKEEEDLKHKYAKIIHDMLRGA